MFIRASVIQKMYFSNGATKPSLKFSLSPVSLEPGVVEFNLDVDGQTVAYNNTHAATTHLIWLIWPRSSSGNVLMKFTRQDGKNSELQLQGPWALFRLFDKTNLQTTSNPRLFKLTFDLNGSSAEYKLLAENIVNPFIPGIVNVFRCPEKL
jgi:type VI secretion system protein ImpL